MKCRSCRKSKFSSILSLGDQYLSDFVSRKTTVKNFPLKLILCQNCNLLQLRHTTPPSLLYTERYGYRSGINETMQTELKTIVEKALDIFPDKKSLSVIDIGANDGTLLSFYPKKFHKVAFEPVKKLTKDCKRHATIVINDYFNAKSYKKKLGDKKAQVITAISCFYDLEEPNNFIRDITEILHEDGIFIIQQNYLVEMLKQRAFDNIVHEHLEYYSLLSLENLLKNHDLEIFHVELSQINGGSFRTYIAFKNKREITDSVKKMRQMEKKLKLHQKDVYLEFSDAVKHNGKKLTKFIKDEVKKGKKVYVYGASTRGNTLLQYYKLDNKLIKAAVERNPEKWGKRIASNSIPIISEEQARKEKPDYMLVLPWFFKEEFLKREKKYLLSGGHFIFPLPQMEII